MKLTFANSFAIHYSKYVFLLSFLRMCVISLSLSLFLSLSLSLSLNSPRSQTTVQQMTGDLYAS